MQIIGLFLHDDICWTERLPTGTTTNVYVEELLGTELIVSEYLFKN